MTEEVIGVVNPVPNSGCLYYLIPKALREKRGITENTSTVILLAENGDIIYRKQGA
ncbi:MAG: hypothetical protein NWF00_04975 [Candidatus Bathyarchaeota archaeon]|nr:hypothetical protein [Candidatus Bathyarchaeota archaeon]